MANIAIYTFNSSIDTLPTFNSGFTYEYTDVNNGDGTITRTIISDSSPSSITFNGKTGLVSLSYLDTSNVTSMKEMFRDCYNLLTVNMIGADTSNVTTMEKMFFESSSLVSVNFSNWNINYETSVYRMFNYCDSLTTINFSGWDIVANNITIGSMFSDLMGGGKPPINNITMCNCNADDVEAIVNTIGTSTTETIGNLYVSIDPSTITAPGWNIYMKIAEYIFNSSTDTVPTFNDGFGEIVETYKVTSMNEKVDIGVIDNITGIYLIDRDDSLNYLEFTPDEVTSDYSRYQLSTYALAYIYNNGESSYIIDNGEPIADMGYDVLITKTNIKYIDVDNGDGTITRTIFNDSLPSSISFYECTGLLSLSYLNTSNVTDMGYMFNRCENLTSIDLSSFDTSKVTDMQGMFNYCENLTSIELSSFDTSNVTDMNYMFYKCKNLTSIDLSSFNTSNVINTYFMFSYCENLTSIDLSSFDTSKVTDMGDMFNRCYKLTVLDLSGFDTSKVTYIDGMFNYCTNLTTLNISNWHFSNLEGIEYMFSGCNALNSIEMNNSDDTSINKIIGVLPTRTEVSPGILKTGAVLASSVDETTASSKYWNVDDDIVAIYTFNSSTDTLPTFNSGFTYSYTDVNNGGTITRTIISDNNPSSISFKNKSALRSVDYLNIENLNSLSELFYNCTLLTSVDTSNWNTVNISDMSWMFYWCTNLSTIDVSSFNTSNVTDMIYMFNHCSSLTSLVGLENFNTENVENMGLMFAECSSLTSINVSSFNTNKTTSIRGLFSDCVNLTTIAGLEKLNTGLVTDMSYLFKGCTKLTTFDMSNLDTSSTTDMTSMFNGCKQLSNIDLSSFNTSNVTDMSYMFSNCTNLLSVNMDNLNTEKLTDISYMFKGCIKLESFAINNLNTSKISNIAFMFSGCSNLLSVDLSNFNVNKLSNINYLFEDCIKLSSLNLNNFDISAVSSNLEIFRNCSNLNEIEMKNTSVSSINKIISELPTKSTYGIIRIDNTDEGVDKAAANSKLWFINPAKIAEYIFNSSTDTVPTFNDGFTYSYIDVNNGGTITRSIISDSSPSSISFEEKTGLVSLSYLDTSNVTDMLGMFFGCTNLSSIDLSSFDTSNVTNMSSMFRYCTSLTTLDLSSFDTSKVTNMSSMFDGCNNLKKVRMDNSNVSSINKIIGVLPTKTSIGKLYAINVIDTSTIDKNTADSNNWKIVIKENLMTNLTSAYLNNKLVKAVYCNGEMYL